MELDLSRCFDFGTNFTVQLINVSENQTFRIDLADGRKFALRLARHGYHTVSELNSEISWIEALRKQSTILLSKPVVGRDGKFLQLIAGHHAFLFEWIEGSEPKISDNLLGLASQLGIISAKLHEHALNWQRPLNFNRPRWDFAAALGRESRWGDWRKGLGVKPQMLPVLSRTVGEIERRLKIYGTDPSRFNLIHGDLRLANILRHKNKLTLIDFDDSGFGWLMYDAATMISFHEHEPQAESMIDEWIAGYRSVRSLTKKDEGAVHTLIMLRRILLLAWLGSHSQTELAHEVKSVFADQSLELCDRFLVRGKIF